MTDKIKGSDIKTLSAIVTDGILELTIDGTNIRIETDNSIDEFKQKLDSNKYELIRV